MAKYSVPGIRFTEIDNTIRTESEPGLGIGAIVMKSNKGPVNQRIVTRNYNEFVEVFGEPESLTDYGHFAAENYFANSTQLFAVRATMGDEQYAQLQFAYPDAMITNKSDSTGVFKYVDAQGDYQLKLVPHLNTVDENIAPLTANGEWKLPEGFIGDPAYSGSDAFYLWQNARYDVFNDIISKGNDIVVYKELATDPKLNNDVPKGIHVNYPKRFTDQVSVDDELIFTDHAWSDLSATSGEVSFITQTPGTNGEREITINIPADNTLNKTATVIQFWGQNSAVSGWNLSGVAYKDIFTADNFYDPADYLDGAWVDGSTSNYKAQKAYKMQICDWEDPETPKTYYVDATAIDTDYEDEKNSVSGIAYTEYGYVDETHDIMSDTMVSEIADENLSGLFYKETISVMYDLDDESDEIVDPMVTKGKSTPRQIVLRMMDENGVSDVSEISNYTYLRYVSVLNNLDIVERIVKETPKEIEAKMNKKLFYLIADPDANKFKKIPVFAANDVETAINPITPEFSYKVGEGETRKVDNIIATPTSYLVNSVDKTYAEGYTILTQSEDEPGNGDIEKYVSIPDQLVIASIGPGKYGNDVGISIITTECANIKALQHQNAFNWKYAYDDEDLVDKDTSPIDQNPQDLTWKKVFRINVYVKNKTQTAAGAWGTGMDALLKDPAESWFVSTDPLAKDAEGNPLFAPTVINGHSDYIYVSRNSTNAAIDCKGHYQQPKQTYSVYALEGGRNSQKNNISEKTAALNFYRDRQKANFDILFNVDAVDTFNGRQRFSAHQRKIAEIAANRTMDVGVVQVTSKAAKTCKAMISEAKMFSFANGSYIAEYGGYDKYYNATLAAWIYLPKSVAGACAMAHCDTFEYPWMAPAGVARGTIPYTTGQLLRLTDNEIGQLYDNNVNTTRDCGGYGVVLWGQKTALKKNSLLNRINVRRCLNYIEKQLENMMTPYLFMQNSVNTRSSARNDIDSFLQRVKAAEGIESYALSVTQDPEDPTIMNVNIRLVPISAIEFIDVKIIINRSRGVSVEEG